MVCSGKQTNRKKDGFHHAGTARNRYGGLLYGVVRFVVGIIRGVLPGYVRYFSYGGVYHRFFVHGAIHI